MNIPHGSSIPNGKPEESRQWPSGTFPTAHSLSRYFKVIEEYQEVAKTGSFFLWQVARKVPPEEEVILTVGQIAHGLLVLLGVAAGDDETDAKLLAEKTSGLRIFADAAGKMNLSVRDVGGGVLVISQFTLLGDVRNGKRPSFTEAAPPDEANRLYEFYCDQLRQSGIQVATGRFRADIRVQLINDRPVTILLDSRKAF